MIELAGAGMRYGGEWAIRGLSFTVPPGEVFGFLGPNGAGKTTTIRMMTGMIRPTEGRVAVAGHDVVSAPMEAKSALGYVPDKAHLYDRLTGREFMMFIASLHAIKGKEATDRAASLLETMGIADVEHELVRNYSHGMRQRLIFASALIHRPRVLIVDEPFVGLDPYGVRTITDLLRSLAADGVTVFLATHSLHIAQDLCVRVAIVHKGRMAALMGQHEFEGRDGAPGLIEQFIKHTSS